MEWRALQPGRLKGLQENTPWEKILSRLKATTPELMEPAREERCFLIAPYGRGGTRNKKSRQRLPAVMNSMFRRIQSFELHAIEAGLFHASHHSEETHRSRRNKAAWYPDDNLLEK
jgi:hypothetical protein